MLAQVVSTLKQIATAAGCSPRAAAAVLNPSSGTVRVGEETRQRVLQAANALGYRRNEFARAMATGQSHVIGVLTSESNSETVMRILEGVLDGAAAQGYITKILRLPYLPAPEQIREIVQLCTTWRLDGVVAIGPREDVLTHLAQEIDKNPRPVAYIESFPKGHKVIQVASDDAGGIRLALCHLAASGHRRIAFLGGRADSSISLSRAQHFAHTLRDLGLPVDDRLVLHSAWSGAGDIEPVAERLLQAVPRPSAILCAGGDAGAMLTLRVARRCGLRLPVQLSVIGYGDSALSACADPALTTIAQPFDDMGRIAVQRLLERIEAEKKGVMIPPTHDAPPQRLIVRDSTALAPR